MGLYEDQLFGAIESVAQRVVDRNGADITVHGEVIKLVNAEVGEYKVKYEGNIFSAYSESPTTVYQDGDDVYVLVPSANFNNKKIILGHASFENSTTNTDINDMTNKYIPLGPNWLSDSVYTPSRETIGITAAENRLSSNERAEIKVSTDGGRTGGAFWNYAFARSKDNIVDGYGIVSPYEVSSPEYPIMIMMSPEALSKADALVQSYGAYANTLMIQADFRTEFIDIHNFGEYKLVVETLEESPEYIDLASEIARLQESRKKYENDPDIDEQYETKINDLQERLNSYQNRYTIIAHELGFADFIGQPYLYPVDTPNTAYISVKPGTVRGLVAVYLMQDGNMSADRESAVSDSGLPAKGSKVLDRMNIFASNINIQFARKVDLLDNLYYSWIEQPEGNEVYGGGTTGDESAKSSILLRAKLYYGYKDILEEDTCQVYWFRENATMTRYEYDLLDEKINRPPLPDPLNYSFADTEIETDSDTGIVIPNSANRAERDQNPPPEEPNPEDPNYEDDYKTYRRYLFWVDLEKYEDWTATKDEWGKTYFDYSGPGWTPVKWIMDQRSEDMETYEISFDELRVPKEEVPIQWQYKVVIVYNGDTRVEEDPTAMVYNTDAAAAGLVFSIQEFNDSALKKEYLRVLDETYPQNKISVDGNPEAGTPPKYPNEEYARWYLSLTDGTYDEITKRGEQYDIGEGREPEQKGFLRDLFFNKNTEATDDDVTITILEGPKHITNYMTRAFLHFNAALYYSDTMKADQKTYLNGLAWDKSEPIANLSYDIITEEGLNFLVTWEGQDTFIYNSDGSIMTEDADVNHTLTYRLNWQSGNGDNYSVTVLGPGRNVLTNEPSKETTSSGSMMTNMWTPVPSNEINFKVRQEFDSSKTENYFILKISSSIGQTWEIRKDIAFLKNGDQGSNGTNWFAPIYPTNWEATKSHLEPFTQKIITQEKPIKITDGETLETDDGESLETVKQIEAELVITDPDGTPTNDWNHLVLRPFVTKNGQDIASLIETTENKNQGSGEDSGNTSKVLKKQYYYKVFWDVRYPNNSLMDPDIKGKSCLRILETVGDPLKILAAVPEDYKSDITEPGLVKIRDTYENLSKSENYTYGEIEIVLADSLTKSFIEKAHYNFYVKATIDIYEHVMNDDSEESAESEDDSRDSKLATITSYYPVDILYVQNENEAKKLDDYYLTCNWPKNIKYNVTGYNPIGRTEPMVMKYSKDNISAGLVEPQPLTKKLIQIDKNEEIEYVDGEPIKTGEYEYTCKPRLYNFWVDNHHAAIFGDIKLSETVYDKNKALEELRINDSDESNAYEIAKAAFDNPNDTEAMATFEEWLANQTDTFYVKTDFFTSDDKPIYNLTTENSLEDFTYYRTIIMDLDIYGGNMAINGWDGTRIDINQDQGTIFAPTIGAGYKDPFKNTFTGVIMGIDSSQSKNNSTNYAKFPTDEVKKNEYMTGLYGYQDGVISFGIMENGTAFFGRADRGGRIVIDGYNAQIYGGFNGEDLSVPEDERKIGSDSLMNMRNRMRLSFIDFSRVSTKDDYDLTNTTNNTVDKIAISTDMLEVPSIFRKWFNPKIEDEDPDKAEKEKEYSSKSGYREARGYSTPAIEIGQYDSTQVVLRELSINDIKDAYSEIKGLEIPGNRRFLVTYDGTMYAMNAFIKGNLVSSNIIGSQFFNSDGNFAVTENGNLCLGKNGKDWEQELVYIDSDKTANLDYRDTWSKYIPVTYYQNISERLTYDDDKEELTKKDFWQGGGYDPDNPKDEDKGGFNFFVSSKGTVICNDIHIAGGSLDIGNFHIIGEKFKDSEGTLVYDAGDVVSFGTMFLVGGKATVAEEKGKVTAKTAKGNINEIALQGWGDVYFRGALTNLGNVYLGSALEKVLPRSKIQIEDDQGYILNTSDFVADSFNSPFSIEPNYENKDYDYFDGPVPPIRGAFWPLHFYISSNYNPWEDKETGEEVKIEDLAGQVWVNLPTGDKNNDGSYNLTNDFMPVFSIRDKSLFSGLIPDYSIRTLFRIDSNGLWSDLMYFRRFESGNITDGLKSIQETAKIETPEVAVGFIAGNSDGEITKGFGIKNISSGAPQMIFETTGDARITTGKIENQLGTTPIESKRSLYLEALRDNGTDRGSFLVLGGASLTTDNDASIDLFSDKVTLLGYSKLAGKTTYTPTSIISINGVGTDQYVKDDFGQDVSITTKYKEASLWMKTSQIAIDGMAEPEELVAINPADADKNWNVTIRLNRDTDGSLAKHKIIIGSRQESYDDQFAELHVRNIAPDHQFGIYARFG